MDGRQIEVSLWDTAGDPEYDHIRPLSYPSADAFLICYNVNDFRTFSHISKHRHKKDAHKGWLDEIRSAHAVTPIFILGTQTDQRSQTSVPSEQPATESEGHSDEIFPKKKKKAKEKKLRDQKGRKVTETHVTQLTAESGATSLECSAKDGSGIPEVLRALSELESSEARRSANSTLRPNAQEKQSSEAAGLLSGKKKRKCCTLY